MGPRQKYRVRCGTCRRRKIKCDNIQPQCTPCQRMDLYCEPYEKQLIFISQLCSNTPTTAASTSILPSHSSSSRSAVTCPNHEARTALPSAHHLQCSACLSSSQMRLDLPNQFLRYYFPSTAVVTDRHCMTWVASILDLCQTFAAMKIAARALGTYVMARNHQDAALEVQSMRLYTKALLQLRQACQATTQPAWYPTLSCSTILLFYEVLNPIQHSLQTSLSHSVGMSALLKMAGPEAFQLEPHHCLFLHVRTSLVYLSIKAQKPSFLLDEKWLDLPWALNQKHIFQTCLDLLLHIPSLFILASGDHDAEAPNQDDQTQSSFLANYYYLAGRLDLWHKVNIEQSGYHCSQPPPRTDLFTMPAIHNFWACRLLLYWARAQFISRLSSDGAQRRSVMSATEIEDKSHEMFDLASDIVSSISHYLTNSDDIMSYTVSSLAATTAVLYLEQAGIHNEESVVRLTCSNLVGCYQSRGLGYLFGPESQSLKQV